MIGFVLNHTPGIAYMRERSRVNTAYDLLIPMKQPSFPVDGLRRVLMGFVRGGIRAHSSVHSRREALREAGYLPVNARSLTQARFNEVMSKRS